MPDDADIWIGWSHLTKLPKDRFIDLDAPENAVKTLPSDLRTNEFIELTQLLTAIWNEEPSILAIATRDCEISDDLRDRILQALRDVAKEGYQFITIRRFLEVIDAGKRNGRFRMRIPYVPAPPPPQPRSPFRHEDFEKYIAFRPTLDAFERSLGVQSSLSGDARWGQAMFSALAYGGLLKARWLLALPEATRLAEPGMRWVYLRPPAVKKEEAPPEPRRWFPDPLTRFLLLRLRIDGYPEIQSTSRADYHRVMTLIRAYARERGFLKDFPKGLKALSKPATTGLHLHLPPWLVAYATGLRSATSLPEWAWERLINPPTRIVSELTPRERIRAASLRRGDADELIADESDDDEAIPGQLRALGSQILKGNAGLRDRIKAWRRREEARLLPSVRLLAEWLSEDILRSRHGCRPPKCKTVYQMINTGGRRLVGQLGAIDPLQIIDEASFIEWYQNALEDAKSVVVRRKVARVLRSFHEFLIARGSDKVPTLEDSEIFTVVGKGGSLVDANVIGLDTFFRAIVWLERTAKNKYGTAAAITLSLIASIAYFGGLRRSEVLGLRVGDVDYVLDVDLFVRPNALRDLKTRSALRLLPLAHLMPKIRREKLRTYVAKRKQEDGPNAWLFPEFVGEDHVKDTDQRLALITDALQHAADDETLRFHHLRHSFATWLLLKFWVAECGGSAALPKWFLPTEHDTDRWHAASKERKGILGDSPTARRSLLQVSLCLGHSGADITLSSYFHLADFILGQMVRRLTPSLEDHELAVLTGRSSEYLARLRRKLKPRPSDEDNVEAELLSVLGGNEPGASGRAITIRSVMAVNFSARPATKLPVTSFAFVLHFGEAIRAATQLGADVSSVATDYQIDESVLSEMLVNLKLLPNCVGTEEGETPIDSDSAGCASVDLPKGEMKLELARKTVEVAIRLYHGKIAANKGRRMNQRWIAKVVALFPEQWVQGSYLTTRFVSLPDAWRWIWFLGNLGLTSGVAIYHYPGKRRDCPSPPRQLAYWKNGLDKKKELAWKKGLDWADGLDLTVSVGEGGATSATRGMVEVSVDLGRVPEKECRFSKVTGLLGIRQALVLMKLIGVKKIPISTRPAVMS